MQTRLGLDAGSWGFGLCSFCGIGVPLKAGTQSKPAPTTDIFTCGLLERTCLFLRLLPATIARFSDKKHGHDVVR